MAVFKIGVPVETKDPNIPVEIDAASPLPVGKHRFTLVVVDDSGNESASAELIVFVADTEKPTAVIDGPAQVPFGQPFKLIGEKSSDVGGGKVVLWRWTMMD